MRGCSGFYEKIVFCSVIAKNEAIQKHKMEILTVAGLLRKLAMTETRNSSIIISNQNTMDSDWL